MKRKVFLYLLKFIFHFINKKETRLTTKYLTDKGWIREWNSIRSKFYYVEESIKERDKIWIEFGEHYYTVWHGPNLTFIALKSSQEWFELYYCLLQE